MKIAITKAVICTILTLGVFGLLLLAIDLITKYELEGVVLGTVMSVIIVCMIFNAFYNCFKND